MSGTAAGVRGRASLIAATVVLLGLLVLSGLRPYDRATWVLEVVPVVVVLAVLAATHRGFPLTTLLYARVLR
jgi:putative membrane protein